ncbi:MAG: hypothetical protein J6B84_00980 [Eubacterium sp.]|nr:hypothetical protein [Eubacterium sp.]
MKKNSEISRMFAYAGNRHQLTILDMILAGLSTVLSMFPFISIWAVGFSALSILLYFLALCCSHLAAFRTSSYMILNYKTCQ